MGKFIKHPHNTP